MHTSWLKMAPFLQPEVRMLPFQARAATRLSCPCSVRTRFWRVTSQICTVLLAYPMASALPFSTHETAHT